MREFPCAEQVVYCILNRNTRTSRIIMYKTMDMHVDGERDRDRERERDRGREGNRHGDRHGEV